MSKRSPHVVIIGAGVGGACLAHGLKRSDVSVSVYDRKPSGFSYRPGIRTAVGAAGNSALQAALPPDLHETFTALCADPPQRLTIYCETLDELFSAEISELADEVGGIWYTNSKSLRLLLHTGIEDKLVFGREFVGYARLPDGRIRAFFTDGTAEDCDALVGADGASSRVRRQAVGRVRVQGRGFLTVFGQLEMRDAAALLPDDRMQRGISMVRGRCGVTLVAQPLVYKWNIDVGLKDGVDDRDAALLTMWPGYRKDDSVDSLLWGVGVPLHLLGGPTSVAECNESRLLDTLAELTRTWDPALRSLVMLSDPDTVRMTDAFDSLPVGTQGTAPIALLGSARCVPLAGAGTDEELRGAGLLHRLIAAGVREQEPITSAIQEYEARMAASDLEFRQSYRRCMEGRSRLQRPLIGPLLAAGGRTGLRVANLVPSLRKRVLGLGFGAVSSHPASAGLL